MPGFHLGSRGQVLADDIGTRIGTPDSWDVLPAQLERTGRAAGRRISRDRNCTPIEEDVRLSPPKVSASVCWHIRAVVCELIALRAIGGVADGSDDVCLLCRRRDRSDHFGCVKRMK